MPDTIDGLPFHPLLVHATVTVLPFAALLVLVAGIWPRARNWLNLWPVIVSAIAVILLPLTYATGDNFRRDLGAGGPLIDRHEHLAHQLLLPVIGLLLAAIVVEIGRRTASNTQNTSGYGRREAGFGTVQVLGGVLAVVAAVLTVIWTVRTGEAGARAVWGGRGGHNSIAQLHPLGQPPARH